VLLDEIEKAHPDVHEIFYQVFDKGHMEDGEGRSIDFRNILILLTSNIGTDLVMSMCATGTDAEVDEIAKALRQPLLKMFRQLLGRDRRALPAARRSSHDDIIRLHLGRMARVGERHVPGAMRMLSA
jgi:type VI secretion system protein VasG